MGLGKPRLGQNDGFSNLCSKLFFKWMPFILPLKVFNAHELRKNLKSEPKVKAFPRILIFGNNWVGDTAMAHPMVKSLREKWPESHIVMAVNSNVAPLWQSNPHIDEIWKLPPVGISLVRLFKEFREYDALFKKMLSMHFSHVLILTQATQYFILSFLAKIATRVGVGLPALNKPLLTESVDVGPNSGQHMVEDFMEFARIITGDENLVSPRRLELFSELASEAFAERLLRRLGVQPEDILVGIAPGSANGDAKRWPSEYYSALADRLVQESRAKIIILGSPSEAELIEEIRQQMSETSIVPDTRLSLPQIYSVLKRCTLFVSNDSGLMHLAAGAGTPTIGIFGSSAPRWTGPFGLGHSVLRKELECSPCFDRYCRFNTKECLKSVTVPMVEAVARKMLKSRVDNKRDLLSEVSLKPIKADSPN
jgi:heptosyltransferase II